MVKFAVVALFLLPFVAFIAWLLVVGIGVLKSEKIERESPTTYHPNRAYLNWRPRDGWPRGPFLSYECSLCGQSIPSKPTRPLQCGCGNVFVDAERVLAQDESKVRLFEEKEGNNPYSQSRLGE